MGQMGQRLGNNGADNDKTAHAFVSTFAFFQPHKAKQKNAKELTRQRTTTTRQTKQQKEGQHLTHKT